MGRKWRGKKGKQREEKEKKGGGKEGKGKVDHSECAKRISCCFFYFSVTDLID